jgi:hypothetical protein
MQQVVKQSISQKLVRSMLCYCNGNGHGSTWKLQGDSAFMGKISFHPRNSSIHRNVRDGIMKTAASHKIVQISTVVKGRSMMFTPIGLAHQACQAQRRWKNSFFEKWRVTLQDLSATLEFCTRSVHNTATKNYDTTRCAHQVPRCLVEEHKNEHFEIAFTLKRKAMSSWNP